MDQSSELLIRIDERVKSLHELLQKTIAAHNSEISEVWTEINNLKSEVQNLKLEDSKESVAIKIRNAFLWIASTAIVGWFISLFKQV